MYIMQALLAAMYSSTSTRPGLKKSKANAFASIESSIPYPLVING